MLVHVYTCDQGDMDIYLVVMTCWEIVITPITSYISKHNCYEHD